MDQKESNERAQRVMEHLQDPWQSLQEITPEVLTYVTEFLIGLQEPYKSAVMKMIAERMVNTMSLHLVALMATFQKNAGQEDILPEDCKETFDQVLPETFRILDDLNKHISVKTLDDLVTLGNVTGSLQTLSQSTAAEQAQNWMYQLPALYSRQLHQEHLVANEFLDWTQSSGVTVGQSMTVRANRLMQEQVSPRVTLDPKLFSFDRGLVA